MKRSKEKTSTPVETIDTLVGSGSILKGDLDFVGGLRVDGHVKGHISAQDTNSGTLVLSESGIVEGDISVPHVIINGSVKGNIVSSTDLYFFRIVYRPTCQLRLRYSIL